MTYVTLVLFIKNYFWQFDSRKWNKRPTCHIETILNIFIELEKGLDRRVQIGIIDSDKDVVYYVIKNTEWPNTKIKENQESTITDANVKELLDKGYQINSGLKFGTHYRVYNYESKHAPWLIHVVKEGINWLDIARMVRVGHGVNKIIVLSYKKKWLSIEWIKPW